MFKFKTIAFLGFLPFCLGLLFYLFRLHPYCLFLVLPFFVFVGYKIRANNFYFPKFDLKLHLCAVLASVLTYYLHIHILPSIPFAAALVCVIMVYGLRLFYPTFSNKAEIFIYAGTFVGMSSLSFFSQPFYLLVAGYLVGFFVNLSESFWIGYGGKLGTLAFLSVYLVFILQSIW